MAEIIGRQIEFGVATEATRGTAETAADKWARQVSATVVEKATHAVDDTTMGRIEAGMGRRVTQKFIEGQIDGILHIDTLGWYLSNIYGICNSTEVDDPITDHVFTLKQNIEHTSLSLFAKDGTVQQHVFNNCMVNTLTLNAAIDAYVRHTATFIGSDAATNSDTPSSPCSEVRLQSIHCTLFKRIVMVGLFPVPRSASPWIFTSMYRASFPR